MNNSFNELPARIKNKIKINSENGCWEWTAALDRYGYGAIKVNYKMLRAHRYIFSIIKKEVDLDKNKALDHLCRNRKCVNPDHLEEVSHYTNWDRGTSVTKINQQKDNCPKCGNSFEEREEGVGRYCKRCKYEKSAEYMEKNRIEQNEKAKLRMRKLREERKMGNLSNGRTQDFDS